MRPEEMDLCNDHGGLGTASTCIICAPIASRITEENDAFRLLPMRNEQLKEAWKTISQLQESVTWHARALININKENRELRQKLERYENAEAEQEEKDLK